MIADGIIDPIVDAHCHILPPSFAGRRRELAARDATFAAMFGVSPKPGRMAAAPTLLKAMERGGVSHAIVMGMGWSSLDVAREANDYLIESAVNHPQLLTGFASVNPAWGDAAVDEATRCIAAGLRGIGELHPDTQGIDITDAAIMSPIMTLTRQLNLPILLHCSEPAGHQYPGKGQTTPDKVWQFIENFPDNLIICAHWGGGLPFYALMPEVDTALGSNIYFDSAASPFLYNPKIYTAATQLAGANRILFASDYPLLPYLRALAQLDHQPLTDTERRAILGENAKRILGLCKVDAI